MATFNEVMSAKIINEAQAVGASIMAKGRAQQRLEGISMAASGKGVKEIQEEMGPVQRLFGKATIGAAHAFALDAGTSKYLTDTANNMSELRKKTTEQFAAEQSNIFSALVTGDPELDTQVMLRANAAVARASKAHGVAREEYLQENALGEFTNKVVEAHGTIKATKGNPIAVKEAQEDFVASLTKHPDMTDEAYKSSLFSLNAMFMSKGDDSLHRQLPTMFALTPADMIAMEVSEVERFRRIRLDDTIEVSRRKSELHEAANRGEPESHIIQLATALQEDYGPEAVGDLTRLLTEKIGAEFEKQTKQDGIRRMFQPGGGFTFATKKEGEVAWADTKEYLRANYDPETAEKHILTTWAGTDIYDPVIKKQVNFSSASPMVGNEISRNYVSMMGTMEPYMQANPEKAAGMFDKAEDLQRYLTIRDVIQGGTDPMIAIRTFADKDAVAARKAALNSPVFKKEMNEIMDKVTSGNSDILFIDDEHWKDAQNRPELMSALRSSMLSVMATSGHTDNIGEVAWVHMMKKYSVVNGAFTLTGNKTFNERLNVAAKPEDVMDHFFATQFAQEYPDYDSSRVRMRIHGPTNTATLWYEDEHGQLQAPYGTGFGRQVYHLAEMGATYTAAMVEAEEDEAAGNLEDNKAGLDREFEYHKRRIYSNARMHGIELSEEELHEQAVKWFQTDTFLQESARSVSKRVLDMSTSDLAGVVSPVLKPGVVVSDMLGGLFKGLGGSSEIIPTKE